MKITNRAGSLAAASFLALAAAFSATGTAGAEDTARPEAVSPMKRVTDARAKASAGKQGETDRVFGGKEAKKGQYPFQVALLSSERLDESVESQPNAQFCGGSLIAPQWVLTAAHCLSSDGEAIDPATVTVLIGATNLAEGKRAEVSEVVVHDGYSEYTLDNDIGLLRLAAPVDAPTIKIDAAAAADAGKTTVIGWGMMEDGTFPNDLMVADLELEPNAACNSGIKEIYASDLRLALGQLAGRMRYSEKGIEAGATAIASDMHDPLTDNMICAGTTSGKRDACNGDSGGPLFVDGKDGPEQIGIVSWGEGPTDGTAACGHKNAYGVYTRLGNYASWVDAKMKTPAPEPATAPGTGTAQKPKT